MGKNEITVYKGDGKEKQGGLISSIKGFLANFFTDKKDITVYQPENGKEMKIDKAMILGQEGNNITIHADKVVNVYNTTTEKKEEIKELTNKEFIKSKKRKFKNIGGFIGKIGNKILSSRKTKEKFAEQCDQLIVHSFKEKSIFGKLYFDTGSINDMKRRKHFEQMKMEVNGDNVDLTDDEKKYIAACFLRKLRKYENE